VKQQKRKPRVLSSAASRLEAPPWGGVWDRGRFMLAHVFILAVGALATMRVTPR